MMIANLHRVRPISLSIRFMTIRRCQSNGGWDRDVNLGRMIRRQARQVLTLDEQSKLKRQQTQYKRLQRRLKSKLYSENEDLYNPFTPFPVQMHRYNSQSEEWVPLGKDVSANALDRGRVLKLVSWNLNHRGLYPSRRAGSILNHLQKVFGNDPGSLVIMFQEVCHESLERMTENPWVQQNFLLSDIKSPRPIYHDIQGENFIIRGRDWTPEDYFTIMMTPKDLGILSSFRVPFATNMGRDALVVDLPVQNGSDSQSHPREALRLCTTHLESQNPLKMRGVQLRLTSSILKQQDKEYDILGGIVGGDMSPLDNKNDGDVHKRRKVKLRDVWEDVPPPPIPKHVPEDPTFGQARGHTCGYQSHGGDPRKRADKFFYTGRIETLPVEESEDVTGNLGRIGIGLDTGDVLWIKKYRPWGKESYREYLTDAQYQAKRQHLVGDGGESWKRATAWASDHFGITVGVRVGSIV